MQINALFMFTNAGDTLSTVGQAFPSWGGHLIVLCKISDTPYTDGRSIFRVGDDWLCPVEDIEYPHPAKYKCDKCTEDIGYPHPALYKYDKYTDDIWSLIGTTFIQHMDNKYCTSTKFHYLFNFNIFSDPEDALNWICIKH